MISCSSVWPGGNTSSYLDPLVHTVFPHLDSLLLRTSDVVDLLLMLPPHPPSFVHTTSPHTLIASCCAQVMSSTFF